MTLAGRPPATPARCGRPRTGRGAVGTLAMDLLLYPRRYRRGARQAALCFAWEFSSGLSSWDEAPVPGQVGKRLFEGLFPEEASRRNGPNWSANITHWAYGMLNGAPLRNCRRVAGPARGPGTGSHSAQAYGPSITRSSRPPCCTSRSGTTTRETLAKDLSAPLGLREHHRPPPLCGS